MLGEKYISPELRQKIIDDLRLKENWYDNNIIQYNNQISKNNKRIGQRNELTIQI